ncbi:MAG: hypothetical protein AB1942_18285 [Pseudomonadota bacterium]
MSEPTLPPMPRGRLLAAVGATLAVAVLVVLGAVLPAEFNRDPLGVGRLSGLSRLWAPDDEVVDAEAGAGPAAREYDTAFRSDVIEIPVGDFMAGADKSELEYKVHMRKGETLTYSWEVVGAKRPQDIYFDQHGHTAARPGEGMTVANYRKGERLSQRGALTAPFDGIHGWFFQNNGDVPVVVRLRLSGFYDLIPSGQAGNEAGIVANVPAAQARPGQPATAAR